jgi:hypothetical protein
MLIQSQLSCNLPLLLICPDYAICVCILKGIGDPYMHPTPWSRTRFNDLLKRVEIERK